jgi:hypothetical protein
VIEGVLVVLVSFFDAGAAAELSEVALLIEAEHVECFSGVVASAGAGGVVDLGGSLHFTKSYWAIISDYWQMELSAEEVAKLQAELQALRTSSLTQEKKISNSNDSYAK